MSLFSIATDSTADLPMEYLEKEDIPVLHLSYTIKGVTYGGNAPEMPADEFYSLMREGNLPNTSQVNPQEAKEGLLKILETTKEILYIAISSGLSGTYNSVRIAAEEIMEDDESVKICVVDSKCASLGEGLLVYKCVEMRKNGASFEDVCSFAKERALNFVHLFTVDDLNHLYRGGRVSKSAALIGTVLNIKPVLHVDDEGHLIPLTKERGRKKALLKLVDLMEEKMGSYKGKNDVVFISHGDSMEDALFVKEEVTKRMGIESFIINTVGPTIGAHSGPGTIALFFMGDVR